LAIFASSALLAFRLQPDLDEAADGLGSARLVILLRDPSVERAKLILGSFP
jgi:hypothetical protein